MPEALDLLDAWEAEDLQAPRPCPDLLRWIAVCRRALRRHSPQALAQVATFAATVGA